MCGGSSPCQAGGAWLNSRVLASSRGELNSYEHKVPTAVVFGRGVLAGLRRDQANPARRGLWFNVELKPLAMSLTRIEPLSLT